MRQSICNPASAFSYYVEGVLCLKSKRYEDAFLKFDEGLRMCSEKELWDSKVRQQVCVAAHH